MFSEERKTRLEWVFTKGKQKYTSLCSLFLQRLPSEWEQQSTWIWILESPATIIVQHALLQSLKSFFLCLRQGFKYAHSIFMVFVYLHSIY